MPSRFRNARRGLVDFWSIDLSSKSSLVFILIFTTIAVIDSTIVGFLTYSNYDLPVSTNIVIFVLFSVTFAAIGSILLNSVKKSLTFGYKLPLIVKNSHLIIYITLTLIIVILLIIIFQMTILHKYNVHLLSASTYVTHVSTLIFLGLLVYLFVGWFKSKKNYVTMLYMISFILISTNIIISLIYLEYNFSRSYSIDRKPYPIYLYVIRQEVTAFGESLATIFDGTYLLSFIAIWIATAILLSQYRYKLGRIKYYTLMSVPMVYYLFTFQGYFGNIFSQFVLHYPVTFGVTYTLFFSATKQIGALLFSLAFLSASFLVTNERVRKSSLISAIGIAILFGSLEITTLQYRLYPPFGLVTEAFMPLGAYLLLVGLITSATSVARDAKLRKEFYKSAMSQVNLLKTIGVTEMEKELMKKYKSIDKRTRSLEEHTTSEKDGVKEALRELVDEIDKDKAREILHEVLTELYAKTRTKDKS